MILKASRKHTFSQGSEDGPTRSDSQESLTQPRYGRVRRRVSLSVLPVNNSDNSTSGTLPQHSCASLNSADLQSCLANKLQQQLENTGSMIYSLSWKDKATPAGRPYCQRAASVPRTKETDFSSVPLTNWQTPTVCSIGARSTQSMQKRTEVRKKTGRNSTAPGNLAEQISLYLTAWPTPTANNSTGAGTSGRQGGLNLQTAATLSPWGTPTVQNSRHGSLSAAELKRDPGNLHNQVYLAPRPTPTTRDHKDGKECPNVPLNSLLGRVVWQADQPIRITGSGQVLTGSDAGMESSGQLNPAHSRWLMGFPPEWDACAVTAMPSSRKSQQNLSKPSSRRFPNARRKSK